MKISAINFKKQKFIIPIHYKNLPLNQIKRRFAIMYLLYQYQIQPKRRMTISHCEVV